MSGVAHGSGQPFDPGLVGGPTARLEETGSSPSTASLEPNCLVPSAQASCSCSAFRWMRRSVGRLVYIGSRAEASCETTVRRQGPRSSGDSIGDRSKKTQYNYAVSRPPRPLDSTFYVRRETIRGVVRPTRQSSEISSDNVILPAAARLQAGGLAACGLPGRHGSAGVQAVGSPGWAAYQRRRADGAAGNLLGRYPVKLIARRCGARCAWMPLATNSISPSRRGPTVGKKAVCAGRTPDHDGKARRRGTCCWCRQSDVCKVERAGIEREIPVPRIRERPEDRPDETTCLPALPP